MTAALTPDPIPGRPLCTVAEQPMPPSTQRFAARWFPEPIAEGVYQLGDGRGHHKRKHYFHISAAQQDAVMVNAQETGT